MKTREEVRAAVISVTHCVSETGKNYHTSYDAKSDTLVVLREEAGSNAKIPISQFFDVYSAVSHLSTTNQIKEVIGAVRYRSPMKAILLNSSLYSLDGRRM